MTTTALALATVTPVTLPAIKPDTYKVVLAMKTPELKQYVRDKFNEGQRVCDELMAALLELKDRAKTDGVWQQTLLDCGIKPGTWRQWQFRDLNKLTVGTRTGNRNLKPTPKIVHVPVTAEQIAAMARLSDAHKQLDKTAAGDGDGAEQANAIIKQCEIDAGVSTEEIDVEDTPVNKTNWKTKFIKLKTELIKLVIAVKHDGNFDMLDKHSRAAVTRAYKLFNSSVFPLDPVADDDDLAGPYCCPVVEDDAFSKAQAKVDKEVDEVLERLDQSVEVFHAAKPTPLPRKGTRKPKSPSKKHLESLLRKGSKAKAAAENEEFFGPNGLIMKKIQGVDDDLTCDDNGTFPVTQDKTAEEIAALKASWAADVAKAKAYVAAAAADKTTPGSSQLNFIANAETYIDPFDIAEYERENMAVSND
jgi:hypothetical protein